MSPDTGRVDVCVVGGAGHVGAPLSAVLAVKGFRTLVFDINADSVASLQTGRFPFVEHDGDRTLTDALASGRLLFTTRAEDVARADVVVVTIGTPVDEFQNPVWEAVSRCVGALVPHLSTARLIVLRSTVAPGTTERLQQFLLEQGLDIPVAFCPERVVQGQAIDEVQMVPQIIGATSPLADERASAVFGRVCRSLVRMRPQEAEYAKLFCNAYRYIQFAASNQFYMMAAAAGCDYGRIVAGIKQDYPRMAGFPGAGFTAGPCLLKDTLQLAAGSTHPFELGYAAMHVNEGLPAYLVSSLAQQYPLASMTVGILGMAFKAGSDDARSSLSYKLKKLLRLRARRVLTTDPLVTTDRELTPVDAVVAASDLLVIGTPHPEYASLDAGSTPVVDIWGLRPARL